MSLTYEVVIIYNGRCQLQLVWLHRLVSHTLVLLRLNRTIRDPDLLFMVEWVAVAWVICINWILVCEMSFKANYNQCFILQGLVSFNFILLDSPDTMTWSKPAIHNMIPLPRSLHSATTIGNRLVEKLYFLVLWLLLLLLTSSLVCTTFWIFSSVFYCEQLVFVAVSLLY